MRLLRPLSIAAFALASLTSSPAIADVLEVRWELPAGCPSKSALASEIDAVAPRANRRVPTEATVTIDQRSGWHAHIDVMQGSARSTRDLDAGTCEALGHAVALVLGLAVAGGAAPDAAAAEPPKERPATEGSAIDGEVRVGGAGQLGVAPGAAVGGMLGFELRWARFGLGIDGALYAPTEAELASTGSRTRFALASAGARTSVRFDVASGVALAPYLGVEIAFLSAERQATAARAADVLPIPLAGVRLDIHLWWKIALYTDLDGGWPLGRSRFLVDGAGVLHEPSVVRARLSAGLAAIVF